MVDNRMMAGITEAEAAKVAGETQDFNNLAKRIDRLDGLVDHTELQQINATLSTLAAQFTSMAALLERTLDELRNPPISVDVQEEDHEWKWKCIYCEARFSDECGWRTHIESIHFPNGSFVPSVYIPPPPANGESALNSSSAFAPAAACDFTLSYATQQAADGSNHYYCVYCCARFISATACHIHILAAQHVQRRFASVEPRPGILNAVEVK